MAAPASTSASAPASAFAPPKLTVDDMRASIIEKSSIIDANAGSRILELVHCHYHQKGGVIYHRPGASPSIDINRLEESTVREVYNIVMSHERSLRSEGESAL